MTTTETLQSAENDTPKIQEAPLPWDAIVTRVLERAAEQHPGETGALRHAESQLRKEMAKGRHVAAALDVAHVASEAMIGPIEDYLLTRAEVHVREFLVHVAQTRRRTASALLQEQLTGLDGFVIEEDDGLEFLAHVGLVLRRDAGTDLRELRRVVDAAAAAANGDATPFPASGVVDTAAFEKDLRAYLAQHDEDGPDFVRRLCDDRTLAEKLANDPQTPNPIQFLARLVLKTKATACRAGGVVGFVHS